MGDIQRFELKFDPMSGSRFLIGEDDGEWVRYEDHAAALAAAEERAERAESLLDRVIEWRGLDGDGITDPLRQDIIAARTAQERDAPDSEWWIFCREREGER